MPQLGDFTVLNASKIFPGKDKLYPWLHTSEKGIRAFGLTPASDVLTDPGRVDDVKVGIRFPVVRMVIHD
jgi:hypothetical protein